MQYLSTIVLAAMLAGCTASTDTRYRQDWSIVLDGGCAPATSESSAPVINADLVFFGGNEGGVYALDASNGAQRWHFHTGVDLPADSDAEPRSWPRGTRPLYGQPADGHPASLSCRSRTDPMA